MLAGAGLCWQGKASSVSRPTDTFCLSCPWAVACFENKNVIVAKRAWAAFMPFPAASQNVTKLSKLQDCQNLRTQDLINTSARLQGNWAEVLMCIP